MNDTYNPPVVWKWDKPSGGRFASINRPISGSTHERELPIGDHPHQLYSVATPNGMKVTIMFEELLSLGYEEAEYDAWLIKIGDGEQFSSGFVKANPNSKIPALIDHSASGPTRIFESGAILLYLAEKFSTFIPTRSRERAECLSWLFWQMGSTPYLGGGFGHFYAYAPEKYEYPINRYAMEIKRQLDVLDKALSKSEYLAGDEYSIADMATQPWYGALVSGKLYNAQQFLEVENYTHVKRWSTAIQKRTAVQRGVKVNRVWGDESKQVKERHQKSDLD
tara:strand:- start:2309 stop:3145 length:837 start_codon:yes stop_codon:yes gene_type:complete